MRNGIITDAEIHRISREKVKAEMRVSCPGRILSFDGQTQLASVALGKRDVVVAEDGTEAVEDPPVLSDVVVVLPAGGGHSLTLPIGPGDEGVVVWSDGDISSWMDNGGTQTPPTTRLHDINDAEFIPGGHSRPNAIPNYDGQHTTIGKDGENADFAALAGVVDQNLNALSVALQACSNSPPATSLPTVIAAVAAFQTALKAMFLGPPAWPAGTGSATVKIKG